MDNLPGGTAISIFSRTSSWLIIIVALFLSYCAAFSFASSFEPGADDLYWRIGCVTLIMTGLLSTFRQLLHKYRNRFGRKQSSNQ